MDDAYSYADEVLKVLYRQIEIEFRQARARLPFDELNVLNAGQRIQVLYRNLAKHNKAAFLKVAEKALADAAAVLADIGMAASAELTADGVVSELTGSASQVTGYIYDNEIERKEARLIEALLAARSVTAYREAFRTAMNLWARQTKQYTDDAVYTAMVRQFREAGVRYVRWYTRKDERVCKACRPRHGKRYAIDKIPLRHYGCRCDIVPIN